MVSDRPLRHLLVLDEFDASVSAGERAMALRDDPLVQSHGLAMRAWVHTARGKHVSAVRDMERARQFAERLEPAAHCALLLLEAQARLFAGQLERAAEQLREARRIGEPVDAIMLARMPTIEGDLEMQSGRPREALGHYARSLEAAQARSDEVQVLFDLLGVAIGCAALGDDEDALLVAGLAEAQTSRWAARARPPSPTCWVTSSCRLPRSASAPSEPLS